MSEIFVVTNRKLLKNKTLEEIISESAEGGASAIIIREKDLSYEALLEISRKAKAIIGKRAKLMINGNYEIAQEVGAEGVQFSYEAFMKLEEAYKGLKGVSVHSLEEAVKAEEKGADYVIAGHIFATDCKKGLPGRGLSFLKEICDSLSIPVIAIGGITDSNFSSVLEAGAKGIALMSSVMESDDVKEYLKKFRLKHS